MAPPEPFRRRRDGPPPAPPALTPTTTERSTMTTTTALLTRHTWGDCPVCGGHLETTPSGAVTCREHRSDHYRIEDEMALGAPVRYLTTLPTRLQPGDPQYAGLEARPGTTC